MKHYGSIHKNVLLFIMLAVTSGALVAFSTMSLGYAEANTRGANASILSPNQLAAGGPLTGNLSQVAEQQMCVAAEHSQSQNVPWYPTLISAEYHDSERSHLWSCASFGGSHTGPNQVYAYQSPAPIFVSPVETSTRASNEIYLYGGATGGVFTSIPSSGPFISRVEVGTLKELWRTTLANTDVTGDWNAAGSSGLTNDGSIVVSSGQYLYKLNGTTGAVEKVVSLPTGKNPPGDSNFNGLNAFPDGTLVLKTQNRVSGCTIQGGAAMGECVNASKVAPSVMVAVDPNTLKVKSFLQLPQMMGGRNTVSHFQGKDYVYVPGSSNLYRQIWNGTALAPDPKWGPIPYLLPGQTPATAPAIIGNWVIVMTNGAKANQSLSVVAISQADPNKLVRINPIPLQSGEQSYIPSPPSVDLKNNRIYAMDSGPGKVAAINLNQATGNMSVAWSVPQKTFSCTTLIGPTNHRLLVGTNINPNATQAQLNNLNYTEQVVWRDAATGKVLARSDYFAPMVPGNGLEPGYGGLIYDLLSDNYIIALQVAPARAASGNSTVADNGT